MPSSRGSSQPRDWTYVSCVSCIAGRLFTAELFREYTCPVATPPSSSLIVPPGGTLLMLDLPGALLSRCVEGFLRPAFMFSGDTQDASNHFPVSLVLSPHRRRPFTNGTQAWWPLGTWALTCCY
ncbi:unnamed protein product [Rangifer tarandus platyrhynchus]|uniref:Uncharacterized protein n=2 Tax=Rangifer tarandus platyrhynchus TaxID=3082113 RepID=A0AC59Y507_RANTA|nr:unnamed protein product [Rangifer tarandus platyrhynchus]